ncbi:hypothetical protein ACP275_08G166900 [Erythranthe tilingii]
MASGSATANKIERAHQMYREGKYRDALDYYTDALSMAKTKPQRIALHSNRAACYLKLHDFSKAAEECTSVLELDYDHTGALMLRAQTLVTLKEYHSALFDVSRLIDLNPSSEVYRNLQTRLKTQLESHLLRYPKKKQSLKKKKKKTITRTKQNWKKTRKNKKIVITMRKDSKVEKMMLVNLKT